MFFENNGEVFWKVTNAFTDGINYNGYNDFVHVLLSLSQLSNPFNEYEDSIGVTPYSLILNGNTVTTNDEIITQLDHTEYPSSNNMHFFCRTKYTNTVGPSEYFVSDFNCTPNTMIRVRLMDFSYAGNDQFYSNNQLLERDIIMPAFYLSYLEYNREYANAMVAINGIVDVIAIITAIPTAGTSTTAAVTVSLATTNIIVTANQSSIQNTSWGNDFMSAWEIIQMIDLGNGLFQISKGITRKVVGGVTTFFLNSDEIITAFKSDVASVRADGVESYQMIRNALKKLANNADTEAAKLYEYIVQELDAEYILNFKNTFLGQGYGMKFFNNRNLAIVKNGNSSGILTLEKNSSGPFLKGNISENIPPNSQLCSSIDDVRFRKNSSTNIEEGDLDVYKKADGSYVVVRSNINNDLNWVGESLNDKLDGLNNSQLKQMFIDDFSNASIQTKNQFNQTPDLVDAWEVVIVDVTIRKSSDKLTKVLNHIDNSASKKATFKSEFEELPALKRELFVDRTARIDELHFDHGPFSWDDFETNGFDPANAPESIKQEIFDALEYPNEVQARWDKVDEFINSGVELIEEIDLPAGRELVKITPHIPGSPNLGPSAYWMTRESFNYAKNHPTLDIEDFLGLPGQNHAVKYDVISVTTVSETTVYRSTIAPTTQGTLSRTGGGEQIIVPNINDLNAFGPRVPDNNYIGWMPE
jgi:hypothetical protein